MLRTVTATCYLAPLREGGSLPALVEADDLGIYVCKFTGAGQGTKALVAEIVTGEVGRRLGVRVPELVLVDVDPDLPRNEPDQEIQDLLVASSGRNLGLDFLPGALGFEHLAWREPEPELAARVLWLDALTLNVDRSWRNPNLLLWHDRLWCIDHGASLFFHHDWASAGRSTRRPYPAEDHILRQYAPRLRDLDDRLTDLVDEDMLAEVLSLVPDGWLAHPGEPSVAAVRQAYVDWFTERLRRPHDWLPEAP